MTETAAADGEMADDNGVPEEHIGTRPHELTPPMAYSVREFCRVFGVGKTYTHELISRGVLKKKYAGKRLLITGDSAGSWFANLPNQPPRKRPPPPTKLGVTHQ